MRLDVDFTDLHRQASKMTPLNGAATMASAYKAGREVALDGATPDTCHDDYFQTASLREAWERGRASVAAED